MELLLNIFEKYGLDGILAICLCAIIFYGGKWLSSKLSNEVSTGLEKVGEKLTDQMSKQNDQLMSTIVNQQEKLIDHLLHTEVEQKELHNEMVNDKIKLAEEIIESLKNIMISHHAQRAFIIEFHNSNNNLSGIPFAKYSCTYEWFDKGLFGLSYRCNSLPFSQIARVTSEVIQNDNQIKIYSDMGKMEEENPSLFSSHKDPRTKQIIYSAMYDRNNVLIGMLILEYQKDHNITNEEINQLSIQTAELTSIINLRYKYSKDKDDNNIK